LRQLEDVRDGKNDHELGDLLRVAKKSLYKKDRKAPVPKSKSKTPDDSTPEKESEPSKKSAASQSKPSQTDFSQAGSSELEPSQPESKLSSPSLASHSELSQPDSTSDSSDLEKSHSEPTSEKESELSQPGSNTQSESKAETPSAEEPTFLQDEPKIKSEPKEETPEQVTPVKIPKKRGRKSKEEKERLLREKLAMEEAQRKEEEKNRPSQPNSGRGACKDEQAASAMVKDLSEGKMEKTPSTPRGLLRPPFFLFFIYLFRISIVCYSCRKGGQKLGKKGDGNSLGDILAKVSFFLSFFLQSSPLQISGNLHPTNQIRLDFSKSCEC